MALMADLKKEGGGNKNTMAMFKEVTVCCWTGHIPASRPTLGTIPSQYNPASHMKMKGFISQIHFIYCMIF